METEETELIYWDPTVEMVDMLLDVYREHKKEQMDKSREIGERHKFFNVFTGLVLKNLKTTVIKSNGRLWLGEFAQLRTYTEACKPFYTNGQRLVYERYKEHLDKYLK